MGLHWDVKKFQHLAEMRKDISKEQMGKVKYSRSVKKSRIPFHGIPTPKKCQLVTKKRTTPSSEVVKPTALNWKKVDIPDTLDDYGGFYGLEEIEGVDVKIVDGKAQFIIHDKSAVSLEDSDSVSEYKKENKRNEELNLVSSPISSLRSEQEINEHEVQDQELQTNAFNADFDLGDVSSPDLPQWQKIASLSSTVLYGLSQQGFICPTEVQKKIIPLALNNEDIMGKSATGSGKTLAYGIPLLENLVRSDAGQCIGIIFTPTRELAQQVTQHLNKLGQLVAKKSKFSILSLTGGFSIQKQERILKYENSARIVVATPGRFLELIEKNVELIPRFALIRTLVLDEADRLLQDGHFEEFEKILKLLTNARRSINKTHWQTMIFSATFCLHLFSKLASKSWKSFKKGEDELDEVLKYVMQKIQFKSKPIIIDINSNEKIKSQIKEALVECGPIERDLYSYYFLTVYPGTSLIFCNSIDSVKKLCAYLNNLKIDAFQIHSSMTQKNRLHNLEKYLQKSAENATQNKSTVLVSSDVSARGLDIPGIKHVLHYHLPRTADAYIHRSGRTARADNEGVSVMICSPEEVVGPLRKLRKMLADGKWHDNDGIVRRNMWKNEAPVLAIDPDILIQLKERSSLASKLANYQFASTSIIREDNWMKKAADDLGIDLDSDQELVDSRKSKKRESTMTNTEAKKSRAYLNYLLLRPIRKDKRQRYLTGGLVNLAHTLVKKRGHESIIGHEKVDALEILKRKRRN